MIPPCDPSILENNPQFKKLYQNLTTSILNPDGSTRAQDAEPERRGAVEVRPLSLSITRQQERGMIDKMVIGIEKVSSTECEETD